MASIIFPQNPTLNQQYTPPGSTVTYKWNGTYWELATASVANSASYATTALTAQTASFLSGTARTASFATTASYIKTAQTASFISTAQTASYVLTAQTASFVNTARTASFVATANTASFATTASYIKTAQTASFVTTAQTASFALTASYALNGGGGSSVDTASFITTGSLEISQSLSGSLKITGSLSVVGNITGSGLRVENNTHLDGQLRVTNDAKFDTHITIEGAAPNLKLRDTSGGGFSSGYDLVINTGSFQIFDDTHGRDVLSDYFNTNTSQHTTALTSENIIISGSTSVKVLGNSTFSGSVNISGSITASLQGTASYSDWALTASRVTGSDVVGVVANAYTASYANFAVSYSAVTTATNSVTASYITGSGVVGIVSRAYTASYVEKSWVNAYRQGAATTWTVSTGAGTTTQTMFASLVTTGSTSNKITYTSNQFTFAAGTYEIYFSLGQVTFASGFEDTGYLYFYGRFSSNVVVSDTFSSGFYYGKTSAAPSAGIPFTRGIVSLTAPAVFEIVTVGNSSTIRSGGGLFTPTTQTGDGWRLEAREL